ncbi:MAG TPA: chemotaxis protein [Pseudolabrys sp.]|nr:chemotaxis protein [Pseudolabrys sp.]
MPDPDTRHAELMDQIRALRTLSAQRHDFGFEDAQRLRRELQRANDTIDRNKQEVSVLLRTKRDEPRIARAYDELGATIDGMEDATEAILKAAEIIDESAKALVTMLKTEYEKGLAQEIQEQVVRLYESCNFQDLAGQRIEKAMATLKFIEERVTAMMEACGGDQAHRPQRAPSAPSLGRRLANGPKLDGEDGHASQQDIDLMFG